MRAGLHVAPSLLLLSAGRVEWASVTGASGPGGVREPGERATAGRMIGCAAGPVNSALRAPRLDVAAGAGLSSPASAAAAPCAPPAPTGAPTRPPPPRTAALPKIGRAPCR